MFVPLLGVFTETSLACKYGLHAAKIRQGTERDPGEKEERLRWRHREEQPGRVAVSLLLLKKPPVPARPLAGSGHSLCLRHAHRGGHITYPHGAGPWGRKTRCVS